MRAEALHALLFAGLPALLGGLLAITPFGTELEERFGLDNLFRLRGPIEAPREVVVVAIDRDSSEALGLARQPDRWSRALYADALRQIRSQGAAAVAFDMLFAEQRDAAGDAALSAALGEAGNVALIYMLERERRSLGEEAERRQGALGIEQRRYPHERFAEAALTTAPFILPKLPVPVHRYWTFTPDEMPSLPVSALQIYALQAHAPWRRLWQRVDTELAAQLPPTTGSREAKRQALAAGSAIRQRLQQSPELAQQLLARLASSDETAQVKRVLSALIRLYAGESSRMLNLYGGPGTITTVPLHRLLDGSAAAVDLSGKTVFFGYAERRIQAQRDGFVTVFSQDNGLDLAGVEIAATAFANLLHNEGITPLPPMVYWGLILFWGALAGLAGRYTSNRVAVGVIGASGLVYIAVVYYAFSSYQIWLPLVVPLFFQAPAGFFLGLALRYRESSHQRRRLKEAFSRFVPAELVRHYSDEDRAVEAGGKLVHGTCLFSDAAQYTPLSECLEPDELGRLVNDYYATVFKPVQREGGIISDVVGDAVMALWVEEHASHTLAARACAAALDIARDTRREAAAGKAHGLPTRIGLHAGPILLGEVGAGDHFEYRAVGDTVNTATRIEGLNKPLGTHLLASEAVVEAAPDMLFRPVGRFVLAGKTQALGVHELLAPESAEVLLRDGYLHRYLEGIAAVEEGHWEAAWKRFSELEREQPQDGPCRYYRMLSETFRQQPPQRWEGVVRLESK